MIDTRDNKIGNYFNNAIDFMNNCFKNNGNMLVHCRHGQSRSATIIAAYLIKNNNMTPQNAIQFLQKKRPQVGPNQGFMDQLKQFEMSNK